MNLVKKLIIGGSLTVLLGIGGVVLLDKHNREVLYNKFVEYAPVALGAAIGAALANSKPVDRFYESIKKAAMRASLKVPSDYK